VSPPVTVAVLAAALLLAGGGLYVALSSDDERARPGAAAAHGPQDWRPAPRDDGPPIEVTRDDGSLPRGCGLRDVARRLADFEHAVNTGDAAAAAAFVAPEPQFQWYWSTLVSGSATLRNHAFQQPDDLASYFARRSRQRERLRPLAVQVNRIAPRSWFPDVADTIAGFNHHLERAAGDIHPSRRARNRVAFSKGGLNCRTGKLVAWGMNLDIARRPRDFGRLCPPPARAAVVACTE
jgi:hypothetical protein